MKKLNHEDFLRIQDYTINTKRDPDSLDDISVYDCEHERKWNLRIKDVDTNVTEYHWPEGHDIKTVAMAIEFFTFHSSDTSKLILSIDEV